MWVRRVSAPLEAYCFNSTLYEYDPGRNYDELKKTEIGYHVELPRTTKPKKVRVNEGDYVIINSGHIIDVVTPKIFYEEFVSL